MVLDFASSGSSLAVVSACGRGEVYVRPLKMQGDRLVLGEGKWQISSTGGGAPAGRSDGKELLTVFEKAVRALQVAPGGQRFLALVAERDTSKDPLTVVVNWPAVLGK